ncbi:MAG: acyl-CoA thioesterase [Planctomycetota bacterium]
MSQTFEHVLTVRFSEVDCAGVVYFQRAFDYAHRAIEELLEAAGCDIASNFARGFGLPLVHAEAEYQRPMLLGERLTVSVSVERMGTSSLKLRYVISGGPDDIRATVRLVHVAVTVADNDDAAAGTAAAAATAPAGGRARPGAFRRIPLPQIVRDGLQRLGLVDLAESAE